MKLSSNELHTSIIDKSCHIIYKAYEESTTGMVALCIHIQNSNIPAKASRKIKEVCDRGNKMKDLTRTFLFYEFLFLLMESLQHFRKCVTYQMTVTSVQFTD